MKHKLTHHLLAALLGVAFILVQTTALAQVEAFYNTNFTMVGNAWIAQGPAPMTNSPAVTVAPFNDVCGAVNAVLPHPILTNVIYVGAVNGGVWRTANATASSPHWEPLTDFAGPCSIGALAFDRADPSRTTIVAGIGRFSSLPTSPGGTLGGLLLSTNSGDDWVVLGQSEMSNSDISSVTMRGNVILAGAERGTVGLFRSFDRGLTWTNLNTPGAGLPPGSPVTDVLADLTDATVYYAGMPASGIYKSVDRGSNWFNITPGSMTLGGFGRTELAMHVSGGTNVLYLGMVLNQLTNVFRSVDQGTNWTALDAPNTHTLSRNDLLGITAHPTDPEIVFLSGVNSVFLVDASQPLGQQVTGLGGQLPGSPILGKLHSDSRNLAVDAGGSLLYVSDGGFNKLPSPYTSNVVWASLCGDLQVAEFHNIAYDPVSRIVFGGTQDNSTGWQTSPGNSIWIHSGLTGDGGDVAVDSTSIPGVSIRYGAIQNFGQFTAFYFDSSNQLLSNTTPALTLTGAGTALTNAPFVTAFKLNAVDATRFIIGGTDSLYESTNSGSNVLDLQAIGSVKPGAIAYGGYADGEPSTNVLWAGVSNTVYLRASDEPGVAPTATAGAYPGATVEAIQIDPDNYRRAYVCDQTDVFRTLDGGTNWQTITKGLTNVGTLRSLRYIPRAGNDWLVAGTDNGVYRVEGPALAPGSLTWVKLGSGFPNVPIYDLDYDPNEELLIAGTLGRGAFLLPIGSTLLVENTNDSGPGSLRQAILEANASTGVKETINFRIPGSGPHTILPLTALPDITDPVNIDGWSQTGVPGSHDIEINGSQCSGEDGLTLTTGNCSIRGLVINRFSNVALLLTGAAATNNWLHGNYIGTSANGTQARGNFRGVQLLGGSAFNVIGTDGDGVNDLLERNVLSGNTNEAIRIGASGNNIVAGNYIGTDDTGLVALPNNEGIVGVGAAVDNIIGLPGKPNVISGNTLNGVRIRDAGSTGNRIQANIIGATANALPLPNQGWGVKLESSTIGNLIGSDNDGLTDDAEGNWITANDLGGVLVTSTGTMGNRILRNHIFDNAGLGIDLGGNGVTANDTGDADTGANDLQNYPELAPANYANVLVGSLSSGTNTTYHIEFFANSTIDGSGNGEGETFIGTTNVNTGPAGTVNFVFTFTPVPGQTNFTATATDPNGNTSEFSPSVVGGLPNLPPLLTNVQVLGNGSFQFGFTNSIGASFEVLTSTNVADPLNTWLNLGAAIEVSPGLYQFSDPDATSYSQRFYSVKLP